MSKTTSATRTVCVFCGAGGKMSRQHKDNAFAVGEELARNGFHLLTGGANVGMMKEVVDGHVAGSPDGVRYGVLPHMFKDFEIQHPSIPQDNMRWPENIHARLKSFYDLCDDIVVLPGGFGTLHELMDCLVHSQYGFIKKRLYLINTQNYWDNLLAQFKVMAQEQAVPQKHLDHLIVVQSIAGLIDQLNSEVNAELIQGVEAQRWESDN